MVEVIHQKKKKPSFTQCVCVLFPQYQEALHNVGRTFLFSVRAVCNCWWVTVVKISRVLKLWIPGGKPAVAAVKCLLRQFQCMRAQRAAALKVGTLCCDYGEQSACVSSDELFGTVIRFPEAPSEDVLKCSLVPYIYVCSKKKKTRRQRRTVTKISTDVYNVLTSPSSL